MFTVLVTMWLMFWGMMWSKEGWLNIFVKFMFWVLALWGAYLSYPVLAPYLGG